MYFEGTLAAGQSELIGGGKHSQFFILECDNQYLDVKFKKSNVSEVRMYKGVPAEIFYDNAVISNPHATSINYQIYCAPIGMKFFEGRNVEAGPTSIFGTVGVVGQASTKLGGSVSELGASFAVGTYTSTGVAMTFFTGVSNLNGVRLVSASLIQTGGVGTMILYSSLHGARITSTHATKRMQTELVREFIIPAGKDLILYGNAGEVCDYLINWEYI